MFDQKPDELEPEDNIELANDAKASDELSDEELDDVSGGLNCVKGEHIKDGKITV